MHEVDTGNYIMTDTEVPLIDEDNSGLGGNDENVLRDGPTSQSLNTIADTKKSNSRYLGIIMNRCASTIQ